MPDTEKCVKRYIAVSEV